MPLPSEQELNPFDDLDGRKAAEHFLGKNIEQAEALFRENSVYYQEDLLWMGPIGFRYYIDAAINVIQSSDSSGDPDLVAGLAGTLEFRIQNEPEELLVVAAKLAHLCERVIEEWLRFDVDPKIYGDLKARYSSLQAWLRRLADDHSVK